MCLVKLKLLHIKQFRRPATDSLIEGVGSKLDDYDDLTASGLGGAYGVARGVIKNGFSLGEMGTHAMRITGYGLGMVDEVDFKESLDYFKNIVVERLVQFNLQTFTTGRGMNLNTNRYFINKNVGH